MNGMLRVVQAEARNQELLRNRDVLLVELDRLKGADHRTNEGHIRKGLEWALELLPDPAYDPDGPWTELVGSVSCPVDGIDVGITLEIEDGAYDLMPARLAVYDGCDSVTAHAYLTVENLDELIDALQHARKRLRARPALPPVEEVAADAAG